MAGSWAGFFGGGFLFLLERAHIPCLWSSAGRTLASSGRCCELCMAGHTWLAEIRPLFFPRPRWGQPEMLNFGHFQPLLGHQRPARARLYPVMTLKKHLCAINFFSLPELTVFFFLSPFQTHFRVEQLHGCRTCFMFLSVY